VKKIAAISLLIWVFLLAGCALSGGSSVVMSGSQAQSNSSMSVADNLPQSQIQTQTVANSQREALSKTQSQIQSQALSQQISFTIFPPLSDAKSRITKKTFGIYITPKTSPVQPERFTGYHNGVDFETLPAEQNIDVPVNAICTGPLLLKKWASGYGGVMVQQCTIANEPVTVIYGHVRLSSVNFVKGDHISAGTHLGVLGTGYSTETDGERKHLHLGIHKGTLVNILGYVQNKAELSNWLDAQKFLS
jgi:murein DD-endopeptidase MepM/ murein hydrolase activator NlpD